MLFEIASWPACRFLPWLPSVMDRGLEVWAKQNFSSYTLLLIKCFFTATEKDTRKQNMIIDNCFLALKQKTIEPQIASYVYCFLHIWDRWGILEMELLSQKLHTFNFVWQCQIFLYQSFPRLQSSINGWNLWTLLELHVIRVQMVMCVLVLFWFYFAFVVVATEPRSLQHWASAPLLRVFDQLWISPLPAVHCKPIYLFLFLSLFFMDTIEHLFMWFRDVIFLFLRIVHSCILFFFSPLNYGSFSDWLVEEFNALWSRLMVHLQSGLQTLFWIYPLGRFSHINTSFYDLEGWLRQWRASTASVRTWVQGWPQSLRLV